MASRLQSEIKQSQPFASLQEEALLNLQRTADLLSRRGAELLKPSKLTPTQYNVLRILRGAGRAGRSCREIGERMIAQDPDITRLLDRLEKRRLIARTREHRDRRVVTTRITAAGLDLLAGLDRPLAELNRRRFPGLSSRQLRQLIGLLEAARGAQG